MKERRYAATDERLARHHKCAGIFLQVRAHHLRNPREIKKTKQKDLSLSRKVF
jgi:hypothetical protein